MRLGRREAELAMAVPPRYPHLFLGGEKFDGNAMMLVGAASPSMAAEGVERSELVLLLREATSGDYANVLRTVGSRVAIWWRFGRPDRRIGAGARRPAGRMRRAAIPS